MPVVGVDDFPDVVAVIPTMGTDHDRLLRCIDSLLATDTHRRISVVCVVNSSTGLPFDIDRPLVHVIEAGMNLGWAGGLVFGAGLTTAPFIWFIQDDMTVETTTLDAQAAALESDDRLGCVGPIVVHNGLVPMGSCGGTISPHGEVVDFCPPQECAPEDLRDLDKTSYVPSRGMMVRRSAFYDAGGPNARLYPVQFVDIDFSYRLKRAGWELRLETSAHVTHTVNGSSPSGFVHFLYSRNIELFASTWIGQSAEPPEPFFPVAALRPDRVDAPRLALHPGISDTLMQEVAQSATDALTHLGRLFSNEEKLLAEARSTVARQNEELKQVDDLRRELSLVTGSRSWKLTSPLRRVKTALANGTRRNSA